MPSAPARRAGSSFRRLVADPRPDQLAVAHREGQPPLDQVERVMAEFLVAPAFEDREAFAAAGGELLELLGLGHQPRRDIALPRLDLQQQLEEVRDEGAVLAEAGAAILARRQL